MVIKNFLILKDVSLIYPKLPSRFINTGQGFKELKFQNNGIFEVDLTIGENQFFGVVGKNGSGKTTLLKVIAGIYSPQKGYVKTNFSFTSVFDASSLLNFELDGDENISIILKYYNQNCTSKKINEIIRFSELEENIYKPVRTYSAGMRSRLCISTILSIDNFGLISDEFLFVNDKNFVDKIIQKIKSKYKIVIIASHKYEFLKKLCTHFIRIDKGKVIEQKKIEELN